VHLVRRHAHVVSASRSGPLGGMTMVAANHPHGAENGGDWRERLKWISASVIPALAGIFGILGYLHFPPSAGVPLVLALGGIGLLVSRWPPPFRYGRAILVIAVCVAVLVALAVLLRSPSDRAFTCSARTCYDFADGTTQGWGVRIENGVQLGTSTITTDDPHVGLPWQRGSLAFEFHIGALPTDKAQIQIGDVPLTDQLSVWVYVPSGTPRTLELFAFVLEHNTGSEPGKPEWPFYKTKTVTLQAGGWTQATFAVSDFIGVNTNQTWSNPPLLLGFEIHPTEPGDFDGIVYFDHITVT